MSRLGSSMRMLRIGTLLAWLIAIVLLAAVTVEVVNRWLEPELHVSRVERSTDPRTVARQISARVAVDSKSQLSEDLPETTTNDGGYSLIGIATGFGDAPGFAMLRSASGGLHSAMLGESLPSGAKLIAIRPDHIQLDQRGTVHTIRISREELGGITPSTTRADDS
ncbi:MAG TPA: type II secretion system protein N [Azoarcus taiwanensis]|nr:type II secretion system protein N [Azoarcus taiwanensis]